MFSAVMVMDVDGRCRPSITPQQAGESRQGETRPGWETLPGGLTIPTLNLHCSVTAGGRHEMEPTLLSRWISPTHLSWQSIFQNWFIYSFGLMY